MSKTREFLKRYKQYVRPWMQFKSGESMSVQYSCFHHCSPRESLDLNFGLSDKNIDNAKTVEVMCYLDEKYTRDIKGYKQDCDDVYDNVPIELIDMMIEEHGGLIN